MSHVPVPLLVRSDWKAGGRVPFDSFARVQVGYSMAYSYPDRTDGTCACGCGEKLEGRQKRWRPGHADVAFKILAIYAGLTARIRDAVFERDGGVCASCGADAERRLVPDPSGRPSLAKYEGLGWEADHIIPVSEGGGGCGLENYRTLCTPCHKVETAALAKRRAKRKDTITETAQ